MQYFLIFMTFLWLGATHISAQDAVTALNNEKFLERLTQVEIVEIELSYTKKVLSKMKSLKTELKEKSVTQNRKITGYYYLHNDRIYMENNAGNMGNIFLAIEIRPQHFAIGNKKYDAATCMIYFEKPDLVFVISLSDLPIENGVVYMNIVGDIESLYSDIQDDSRFGDTKEESLTTFFKLLLFDKFL